MLKPTYFDGAQTDLIESYYEKLENWLMNDIAQRLLKAGEMSGTADRNIWLLEQLGLQKAEINTKLSQLTKLSDKELKAILQDAVLTSWKDDASTMAKLGKAITSPFENQRYMQVINAEFQKCKGELSNLTQTTMDTAQSDLIRMLNEADMRVASGSQSYSGAVCELMDEYAKKGIQVGYPTVSYHNDAGDVMRVTSTRSLESAIQTALRTSMNQTAAQVTNQYINDNGIEYVLVSAHLGARHSKKHPESLESHDWWQGKAFKIRGSEEGYPNLLESTGYDIDPVTGEGMVVNPLGLHGYNCRHSHQPWDKDLKNPWIDENGNALINQKESQKVYEKQQTQRGMERSIRSTKRQLIMKKTEINGIAETDVKNMLQPQYDKLAYKLREQNKAYDQFCQDNNLNKQAERIKVIGFKRQQEIDVRKRAKEYEKKLSAESTNSNYTFKTRNDPIREYIGAAEESHPEELKKMIDDLKANGIEIIRRKGAMGYSQGPFPGKKGQILVEPGASISAWKHEYKHFTDDRNDGYPGFRIFEDIERCIKREKDAYQIEIDFARQLGYNDVVERLEKLMEEGIEDVKKHAGYYKFDDFR